MNLTYLGLRSEFLLSQGPVNMRFHVRNLRGPGSELDTDDLWTSIYQLVTLKTDHST